MEIDLKNFETLLQNIPKELMVNRIFICESGLETRSDIRLYAKHANAVLVGTGILLAADREQKLIDITAKPQVKICGITNQKDALLCSQNASYLGFVFVMESLRSITVKKAKEIIQKVRDEYFSAAPRMVGVFVNADSDELKKYDFLDVFQFHGEESPDFCERMQKQFPEKKIWKAIKIRQEKDLEELKKYTCCDAVLIDAFSKEARGGTGKQIPVTILEKISEYITTGQKFFVAGGVSSENITDIVRGCFPDGVDLVSSLEKEKGIKDTRKLEYFFSEIKKL
jgi:phosphoribosylanthranilate isomerase